MRLKFSRHALGAISGNKPSSINNRHQAIKKLVTIYKKSINWLESIYKKSVNWLESIFKLNELR